MPPALFAAADEAANNLQALQGNGGAAAILGNNIALSIATQCHLPQGSEITSNLASVRAPSKVCGNIPLGVGGISTRFDGLHNATQFVVDHYGVDFANMIDFRPAFLGMGMNEGLVYAEQIGCPGMVIYQQGGTGEDMIWDRHGNFFTNFQSACRRGAYVPNIHAIDEPVLRSGLITAWNYGWPDGTSMSIHGDNGWRVRLPTGKGYGHGRDGGNIELAAGPLHANILLSPEILRSYLNTLYTLMVNGRNSQSRADIRDRARIRRNMLQAITTCIGEAGLRPIGGEQTFGRFLNNQSNFGSSPEKRISLTAVLRGDELLPLIATLNENDIEGEDKLQVLQNAVEDIVLGEPTVYEGVRFARPDETPDGIEEDEDVVPPVFPV